MIEHIINDVKDVNLVEIAPDGACYVMCVLAFLKRSKILSLQGYQNIVQLGTIFFYQIVNKEFTTNLLNMYSAEGLYDGQAPTSLTIEEKCDLIAQQGKDWCDGLKKCKSRKEKLKYTRMQLSNVWNEPIADLFMPAISMLLHIEIIIWRLSRTERNYELIVERKYGPGSADNVLDSCNAVLCRTSEDKSHFQLMLIPSQCNKVISTETFIKFNEDNDDVVEIIQIE